MSNDLRIGLGASAAATAAVIALVATGGQPSDPTPSACAYSLSARGTFAATDDTGRCDLIFTPGKRMRCELAPITDITYPWSYRATPLGIVTSGLQRGAVVAFECEER